MLRTSYFTRFIFTLIFSFTTLNAGVTRTAYSSPACAPATGNVQLVLLGIVLDEATLQPIDNMMVQLIDNFSKQTEQSLSSSNGNFYFPLQADKLYTIQLLNPNGALICSKNISTVNRLQPEILQVLLSVPAVK